MQKKNCQNVCFWKSKNGKLFSRKIQVTEKSSNFYTVRGRLLIASRGHEVVGFMIHKRKIEEILISQTIPLLFPCALFRVSPPLASQPKTEQ